MRRAVIAVAVVILAGAASAGVMFGPPDVVAIERFTLVESHPYGWGQIEETYSATAVNRGGPGKVDAVGITAVVESRSPQIAVVDGSLTFGNLRARTTAVSRDTLTIRRSRWVPLNHGHLSWRLSWNPDEILPETWAGTWRFEVRAFDLDTGALESRETTTDIVRPDDALGLALVREPARCKGGIVGDVLRSWCWLEVTAPRCRMIGRLQLDGARNGDAMNAHGEWRLTVSGDCGPLARGGGQRLEIVATKTSPDTAAPYESSTSLVAKLVPPSPLLVTSSSVPQRPPAWDAECMNQRWRRFLHPRFSHERHCIEYVGKARR